MDGKCRKSNSIKGFFLKGKTIIFVVKIKKIIPKKRCTLEAVKKKNEISAQQFLNNKL